MHTLSDTTRREGSAAAPEHSINTLMQHTHRHDREAGVTAKARRTFSVLHGATKALVRLPAIAPRIVSGKATNMNSVSTTMIVPKGRAAVEEWPTATKFRITNPSANGTAEHTGLMPRQ